MKTSVKIISITIAIVGFTAFGFIAEITDTITSNSKIEIESIRPESLDEKKIDLGLSELKSSSVNSDLPYIVRRSFSKRNSVPITMKKLYNAAFINDVIKKPASDWITGYQTYEVSRTINGKEIKAASSNATLTKEQKQIFNSVSLGAEVLVSANYTSNIVNKQINVSLVVIPEKEAEYIGGYDNMINYLKENSPEDLSAKNFKLLPQISITFNVNESGKTENVKMTNTSGNTEVDELLLELVQKMPNWNPATNINGTVVKQNFVLEIGQFGC
jgi:TonB family protein